MKNKNYKNLVAISLFAIISILIWILTPYWFADPLLYINDSFVFILLVINFYTSWRSSENVFKQMMVVHSLGVVELLMFFQGDDCGGILSIRLGYFLKHYFNLNSISIDERYTGFYMTIIALILVSTIYLEYKIIKRAFLKPKV